MSFLTEILVLLGKGILPPYGHRFKLFRLVDDKAVFELWHWKDAEVQSVQKQRAESERNRTFLTVWQVAEKKLAQIAGKEMQDVMPSADGRRALGNLLWGSAEMISFRNANGVELQGIIYKPENFNPLKNFGGLLTTRRLPFPVASPSCLAVRVLTESGSAQQEQIGVSGLHRR